MRTRWWGNGVVTLFVSLLTVAPVAAQLPTLTPADYGRWERLGAFELDPAGRWLVNAITYVDGDRELRLRRTEGDGDAIVLEYASGPRFSSDGRWLAYEKGVSADEAEEAEEPVPGRLGLVDLDSGRDSVHFEVTSFAFRDDGAWLVAHGVSDSDSVGADLVVMDPRTGARTLVGNVDQYAWQDDGPLLAATLRTAWGGSNGVILFDPDTGTLRTIDSGDSDYAALTWMEDSSRLAVLRSVEGEGREDASHDVLVWEEVALDGPGPAAAPSVLDARTVVAPDLRITPFAGIRFGSDGRSVFVGVRPWNVAEDVETGEEADSSGGANPVRGDPSDDDPSEGDPTGDGPADGSPSTGDDADDDVEPADVQVWHWNDDQILRAQEYGAARLARRTSVAVWHLDSDDFVVLGDDLDEPVSVVAGGRWGLVPDYDPYLFERRFGAGTADWYRVDATTGERVLLAEAMEFGLQSRFDDARVLGYTDDRWVVLDVGSRERTAVGDGWSFTQSLADYDFPGQRPSWGLGGWVEDGAEAFVYDEHDVWEVGLDDGSLRQLTDGSASGHQYRLVDVDPEASAFGAVEVASDEDLWLSVRDLRSKASGYARIPRDGGEPRTLLFEEARVSGLTRAADADRFALRTERWDDSPDVFVGDGELDVRQLTRTNPMQSDHAWGSSELLAYTTDAGHDLQAILVYPADFREGEQYPLILYQYERLSDNLHVYDTPSERDYYNDQAWSQEGYFVLMPDIVYEPGRPGPSALDAVEHALDAAVATGHVDPDRMGLIGHSWGGYQASYLPTRTNRFAASVAGAAITNFMSFMGAVHWNGGLPETGHWETGQARMAVPYWEDLEGHLESSPANFITDLETPMLLMHGDADGVVDFRQGLEFYNYARRAGKEVVLLVYPGADHGLSDEAQQIDYHRRILEWFGHYLKGEPAPTWIEDGESWEERAKRIGG